jgi:hypothetical protein
MSFRVISETSPRASSSQALFPRRSPQFLVRLLVVLAVLLLASAFLTAGAPSDVSTVERVGTAASGRGTISTSAWLTVHGTRTRTKQDSAGLHRAEGRRLTIRVRSSERTAEPVANGSADGPSTFDYDLASTALTRLEFVAANTPGQPVPAPKELEAFPDADRAKPKTPVQGGGGLRQRWKDSDGNIYEWNRQHGTVEKYNKRGKHQGEYDPKTGKQTKPANPDYRVEP